MNSNNPIYLSRSRSGGWSSFCDMLQGQKGHTPGLRCLFHSEERETIQDPVTGNFTKGDRIAIAETYTIRFGVNPPNPGAGEDNTTLSVTFDAVARITSKVAGNMITRYVQIGYGTAVTLTAEGLDIDVFDETDSQFWAVVADVPVPQTYRVTMQVAPGLRASFEVPPTLKGKADVVNGAAENPPAYGVLNLAASTGAARYPVPQNAGVVSCEVIAVDGTTAATFPVGVTATAFAGTYASKMWNPSINTGFIVLPPNTTFVEVANTSSSDPVDVTLTWGIEG